MKEKLVNFFSDAKDVSLIILGIIGSILGALFYYEKKKNEVQQAENLNAETKGKLEAIDDQIKSIEDETKEKKDAPITKDDLLKFLNDKSNK